MANYKRWHPVVRRSIGVFVVLSSFLVGIAAAPPPPNLGTQAEALLKQADIRWSPLKATETEDGALSICLSVPVDALRADQGMGAEVVMQSVRRALTPLPWQVLRVQARDPQTGQCRPLSDYLPSGVGPRQPSPEIRYRSVTGPSSEFPRSLVGKTVYVSAGHGWQWGKDYSSTSPAEWRTQRTVYEGLIEDHNNIEAVAQYLVPYLEQAGATVIPVRERDWNANRIILDNDVGAPAYVESGTWDNGATPGYAGGTYRTATTVSGPATASATWTLNVPLSGTYALYAWVTPGGTRAPDAHYVVSHAAGDTTVRLDQRIRPETWRYLGQYPFYAGVVTVTLFNDSSVSGASIVADALKWGGGIFDDLTGIETLATLPPDKPWWESATYYYAQWMGLDPDDWPYFNDIVARPMFARWNHQGLDEDAVYISWHTNGYDGTIRGTESYVHNEATYPRTEGSLDLQQAVHDALVHDIRAGWDASWSDRGKKQANLGELRMLWDDNAAMRMPGVLLEIAFHDQVDDANALKEPGFNQLAARAIYQGIVDYFEQRDSVDLAYAPEPPTHLRVQNVGNGSLRVAWQASPTDTVGVLGDAATAYRVYTSRDGFAWGTPFQVLGTEAVLTGLSEGAVRYVRVTAVNEGGESFPTEVLGARVSASELTSSLLIVNGFDKLNRFGLLHDFDPIMQENLRMVVDRMNARDYVVHHGQSVPQTIAWDSASNEAIIAGLLTLDDYAVVDWILGEESTDEDGTLNAVERAVLTAFLQGDGALFISGTELAWDLESVGRDPVFLNQTLHTDYVLDDAGTYTVTPDGDGVFAGLDAFSFDAPGEYDADYPDVIAPLGGASSALQYSGGTGGTAALQYQAGCQRLIVMGFPFEMVRPEHRSAVMSRALDFLGACGVVVPPQVTITSPQAGDYYSSTPTLQGSAMGTDLSRVEIQLAQGESGADAYWGGSVWLPTPIWLTATGTSTWSYAPVTLPQDTWYVLRARSVAAGIVSDPVEVAFFYDATPPLTPTLVSPLDGSSFSVATMVLDWDLSEDTGSPLSSYLELDGELRVLSTTTYVAPTGAGLHSWRVRAGDAAGNVSPWSPSATFVIDIPNLYLPLVLRNHMTDFPLPTCSLIFESGFETEDGWLFSGNVMVVDNPVHSGGAAARIGLPPGEPGGGEVAYASVRRELSIDADVVTATLRYWVYPINEGSDPDDLHYVIVKDAEDAILLFVRDTSDARAWEQRTLDLSPYVGQSMTLYFGVMNDGDDETAAIYLDDVYLEGCR